MLQLPTRAQLTHELNADWQRILLATRVKEFIFINAVVNGKRYQHFTLEKPIERWIWWILDGASA